MYRIINLVYYTQDNVTVHKHCWIFVCVCVCFVCVCVSSVHVQARMHTLNYYYVSFPVVSYQSDQVSIVVMRPLSLVHSYN